MNRAVEALAADRAELLRIGAGLDADRWAAPSGCPGWSVQDVVAHLGALFWAAVDPAALPDTTGLGTEEAQEVYVRSRRTMTAAEVLADYAAVSEKALAVLDDLAGLDMEMPLGDLGTYPVRVLPAAFCFDHYTHIRTDLFAPRGPLSGTVPASDELRVAPTLEWIAAALPQQNRAVLDGMTGAADIVITGTAARTIRLGGLDGPPSAAVRSDAETCVRWITQRAAWEDLDVQAEGDPQTLADLRSLKVF